MQDDQPLFLIADDGVGHPGLPRTRLDDGPAEQVRMSGWWERVGTWEGGTDTDFKMENID